MNSSVQPASANDPLNYDSLVQEAVKSALRDERTSQQIYEAGLNEQELVKRLQGRKTQVLSSMSRELNLVQSVSETNNSAIARITSKSSVLWEKRERVHSLFRLLLIMLLAVFIAYILRIGFWSGWSSLLSGFFDGLNLIVYGVLIVAGAVILLTYWRQFQIRNKAWSDAYRERDNLLKPLQDELKLRQEQAKEEIINKGILPELRLLVNQGLDKAYSTELNVSASPGLSEVFDPVWEVPTEAKKQLMRLFDNMPGGSIGIAGPRGIGKSTLLSSFHTNPNLIIKGRPALTVGTTAPVRYEYREFITHLFLTVCQRFLELEKQPLPSNWQPMDSFQQPQPTRFLKSLLLQPRLVWDTLLLLGVGMLLWSVYIANIAGSTDALSTFIKSFKFDAGILLTWGFLFTILSVTRPFILRAYGRQERDRRERSQGPSRMHVSGEPLIQRAHQLIADLRFQQSYSSGWGGALKLPIGIETSQSSTLSLAQRQQSMPEIIRAYKAFLHDIHSKYQIVIAIDELDKIETAEDAQRFLNELKAIFGIEHCFYLLSVSESAMSSFERRGLNFRDVFDSSFDSIIYMDYMDLATAKHLLRRRVIGIGSPFLCLCYCLSGGLPRDLIRACRDIVEQVQVNPSRTSLTDLCQAVVQADIRAKLRAIAIAAHEIGLEPETTQSLQKVRELEQLHSSPTEMLRAGMALMMTEDLVLSDDKVPARIVEQRGDLTSLTVELGTYLYYSATLLEFFTSSLNEPRLLAAEASGSIAQLAKARQQIAMAPRIAQSLITEFRSFQGLVTPSQTTSSVQNPIGSILQTTVQPT
jgi:hypothetical protein